MRCFYTTPPPSIPPEQLVSGSRRVSRQSCLPVDPAQYPARAARQWIPPSIPPERLASGSRRVSRRAARQWIPPSILPERLASGSRRVFCQRGSPVDPAEYPASVARQWIPHTVARQWIPPSIPLSIPHSSSPVDPAEYPAEYPLPVDPAEYPPSIKPERLASIRQWIPPVSRQKSSPVWFCLMSRPARSGAALVFCERSEREAFVLLWVVNKQLRLIPRQVCVWKGLGFC